MNVQQNYQLFQNFDKKFYFDGCLIKIESSEL